MADNNHVATSKNEAASHQLEQFIKEGYKILIDTCSLLMDSCENFWINIIPFLEKYNSKVIVPLRCGQELEKHQSNTSDIELANKAKNSLKKLNQLIKAGYVVIHGENTDNFADNVFMVVFTKFRMTEDLLLITQDKNLAEEILKLNESKSSISKHKICVKKLNRFGYLSPLNFSGNVVKLKKVNSSYKIESKCTVPEDEKFDLCNEITEIKDEPLPVKHIPGKNETVYVIEDKEYEVQLIDELGAGGEAIIYTTNTPFVAKIYKKKNNTRRKYEKIKLMLSKHIEHDGICYPVAALYNTDKEFVGVLMPKAVGKELQRGIFIKPLFLKNFPNWKKRDTVELCITILEKIKYLHDRNIILGDINPANILVVSPKEVYFVDTDSYQIEGFPCPVGFKIFTAPEIIRKPFGDYLRSFGNEYFAVATLLFMIMLPGKQPYSQQGGEDQVNNIIQMDFSYPFGESSNKKTPDGPWRFIWSHLTYDLKEAFYTTFKKGEAHSTENTRLSVDEWLSLFRYYLELLDSGKYGQQDAMSEELFPTRHKKSDKFTYVTCKLCGTEVPENNCQNGYCRNCLNKGESYKCSRCGKEIVYTNYQKLIKNAKKYDTCFDCYQWGQQVYKIIRCEDCGRTFELNNSQNEFYLKKGLDLPKRCKSCRDAKKNSFGRYSSSHSSTSNNVINYNSTNNGNNTNHGSFCFITTAVCEYFGKPDNCNELMSMRHFRDTWLRQQPDGEALINEYYNTAPLIVSLLKQSEKYSDYCERLMTQYISPCVKFISEHKYNECKALYTEMFYYMKSELLN